MTKQNRKSKKSTKISEESIEETFKHKSYETRRKEKDSLEESGRDNEKEINEEFDDEHEEEDSEYEIEHDEEVSDDEVRIVNGYEVYFIGLS